MQQNSTTSKGSNDCCPRCRKPLPLTRQNSRESSRLTLRQMARKRTSKVAMFVAMLMASLPLERSFWSELDAFLDHAALCCLVTIRALVRLSALRLGVAASPHGVRPTWRMYGSKMARSRCRAADRE